MDGLDKKSSTGLDENIAGLLCYAFGWISGLIFFLIEKDSRFVRFHAVQSMVVFGAVSVIWWIVGKVPFLWLISPILGIAILVLYILLIYKAYKGEMFKLPVSGDIAEKQANTLV